MQQNQDFIPATSGSYLSEEQIRLALKKHYPNFEPISTEAMLQKLANSFDRPITAAEFDRQIQLPGSAISQAFFVCLMTLCQEQALQAMFYHNNLLSALKDRLVDFRNADTSHEFITQVNQIDNKAQQMEQHLNHKRKLIQQFENYTNFLVNHFNKIGELTLNQNRLAVQLREEKQKYAKQFNALAQKHGYKKLKFTNALHMRLDQAVEKLAAQHNNDFHSTSFEKAFQQNFDNTFDHYIKQSKAPQEDLDLFAAHRNEYKRFELKRVRAVVPFELQFKTQKAQIHGFQQEAVEFRGMMANISQQLGYSSHHDFNRINTLFANSDQLENQRQQKQYAQFRPTMGFSY